MELKELEMKAQELRGNQTKRVLGKYHYARDLGFSSSEAMVLMGKSKDNIDKLARERGYIKKGGK